MLFPVRFIPKLCAVEQADNHKVWIDIDGMGGSTLEAMAGAVENAKVVLMCLSEQYKLSTNCRSGTYSWYQQYKLSTICRSCAYS